jgi:phosphatidylserine/phosphatidylglycerophosphate/cardiolipin synthase-like enzyme
MSDCDPKTWFLTEDDEKTIMEGLKVTAGQLLSGRKACWQSSIRTLGKGSTDPLLQDNTTNPLLMPYTSDNLVTALVDGKEYMVDLSKRVLKLGEKQGDFLLITGWEFWKDRWLDADYKVHTYLESILRQIALKKANIRLLSYKNNIPFARDRTRELVDTVNSWYPGDSKVAYLDGELGYLMSHHQKSVFLGRKDDFDLSCAYVGGMDLAIDRWDDEKHQRPTKEGTFYGWHDVQVRVLGDAITQIWANFLDRWNSKQREVDCPIPSWKQHTKLGNQHVQVLRTVASARSSKPDRFMIFGERTILCALKKAISQAECYIYIEEQFLWDCEIADFIVERNQELKNLNKPKLRLIVVLAAETELKGIVGSLGEHTYHLRSLFFMKVMEKTSKADIRFGHSTGVYAYGLYQNQATRGPYDLRARRKPIYVHSKLIIIDDRYVAIGSANVDARSMHIETELTLGIVDGDTVDGTLGNQKNAKLCRFAVELRQKLWKEHLGISKFPNVGPPDPIAELQEFPGVKGNWPANEKIAKTGRICPECGHISLNSTPMHCVNIHCNSPRQPQPQAQKHHVRCYVNRPGRELLSAPPARLLDREERRFRRYRL